ncbi:MAG TPA: glycoside hydrolase family 76 protein [Acidimicrobiales bacterium]|nr:glycoside hydrolase family 76 protein [Acidimicrobiales bacterium]
MTKLAATALLETGPIPRAHATGRRGNKGGTGHEKGRSGVKSRLSGWRVPRAIAATDYVDGLPGQQGTFAPDLAARLQGLSAYLDAHETTPSGAAQPAAYASAVGPPLGTGGTTFYDDNAWVTLDLLYAYKLTGNKAALTTAENEFHYVVSGWDTTTTDACPGGVFWEDTAGSPRNTVSNGPNAEAGLLIYQATGDNYYLTWAEQMYNWVRTCLLAPSGMYYDHLDSAGTVNTALWSYNQGTMIGAGVLLYDITGQSSYLQQATQTANASVQYYGSNNELYQQPDVFNTIFFRNLFALAQVDHNSAYQALAASYANTAWAQDRQVTGLFTDPDPNGGESLVNQTAPMAELYALLGGSPPSG